MTRNRSSARAAGTRAETAVARYLSTYLHDERIERRAKNGAKDRGDIAGLLAWSRRIVVEVKDVARLALAQWVDEADVERRNDDALLGVVWHKRRGTTDPGEWYVTMSGADFIALLGGYRPDGSDGAS